MTRLRKLGRLLRMVLMCKEVRPYEAAILRVAITALLAQYGIQHL